MYGFTTQATYQVVKFLHGQQADAVIFIEQNKGRTVKQIQATLRRTVKRFAPDLNTDEVRWNEVFGAFHVAA